MPQNSLTLVIDENGVYYRIPISCINEPINYSVNYLEEKIKSKPKPAEKMLNVSLDKKSLTTVSLVIMHEYTYFCIQNIKVKSTVKGDVTLQISNLLSIADFKKLYLQKVGDQSIELSKLRLFCLGKELKDDLFIYSYNLSDEMAVQVMVSK